MQRHGRLRIGEQQNLVGVAHAGFGPGRWCGVGRQQHEVVLGLGIVEAGAHALRRVGVRIEARGQRPQRNRAAMFGQPLGQCMRKAGGVDASGDRHQGDRRGAIAGGRPAIAAQPLDDLPRDGAGQRGTGCLQALEARRVQACQHGVAHRHHRGRTRFAGDQAHLADQLAAAHVAHRALGAFAIPHIGAQTARHHQIQCVTGLALVQQRLAARQRDALQPASHLAQHRLLHVRQPVVQQLHQPPGKMPPYMLRRVWRARNHEPNSASPGKHYMLENGQTGRNQEKLGSDPDLPRLRRPLRRTLPLRARRVATVASGVKIVRKSGSASPRWEHRQNP